MKNFVFSGATINVTAEADTSSGAVVVVGDLAGIAGHDAKAGEDLVVHLVGVYENLPKVAGQVWAQGVKVYWIAADSKLTTAENAGANKFVGHAYAAAANGSAVGTVRLGR